MREITIPSEYWAFWYETMDGWGAWCCASPVIEQLTVLRDLLSSDQEKHNCDRLRQYQMRSALDFEDPYKNTGLPIVPYKLPVSDIPYARFICRCELDRLKTIAAKQVDGTDSTVDMYEDVEGQIERTQAIINWIDSNPIARTLILNS